MPLSGKNKNIIKTYFKGFESKEELSELKRWFDSEDGGLLPDRRQQEQSKAKIRTRLLAHIKKESRSTKQPYLRPILRIAAAVTLLVSGALGYFYYTNNYVYKELDEGTIAQIMPIQDSVRLTFEDGKVVFISSEGGDQKIGDAQAIVDGQLVYNHSSDRIVTNTVSTPKGHIFKINLPDGTNVWMNANSNLSFPSKFQGAERVVRLNGEAYFEVAKSDKQPFVVTFADQKVKVLGTHFNIAAYDDVQRTTLMEGKVQLERGNKVVTLAPNEQVIVVGDKIQKKSVDASEYGVWRDGYFVFHNATPNEIMQQLTQWYDLKIKPDGSGSKERFSGKINKELDLAKVLEVLEAADIHFKISENKLKHKEIELRE